MDDLQLGSIPKAGQFAQKPEPADSEFITTRSGEKVYDKGEAIVQKMERNTNFDKDLFFTELYENYLVCVQRNAPRERPSGIITRWDESTSFGDFLSDSLELIDHRLTELRMAKEAGVQKFRIVDDSVLAEMKIDSGSSVVGQRFKQEDFEVAEELLRRSKETILDYKSERLTMAINSKTGRVRTFLNTKK
jgi:hypothetical protein